MDLNELKQQLDSDAQRRCKDLEIENRNLKSANRSLLDLLKERDSSISGLQNRCYAFTRGTICHMCIIKIPCSGRTRGRF
jgi:hypothetical protein